MAPFSARTIGTVFGLFIAIIGLAKAVPAENPTRGPSSTIGIDAGGTVRFSVEGFLEERLAIPPDLGTRLNSLDIEEKVQLVNWPVAPGDRRTVVLKKTTVTGPSTRIIEIGDEYVREIPPSPRALIHI
mgnify:CR=1 FL=1